MSKGNTGRRRKDKEILFYIQPSVMNLDYKENFFIGKKNEPGINLKEGKDMVKMVNEYGGVRRNQIQKKENKTTKIKSFRMIKFILIIDLFFQVISFNNEYLLIKYNISNDEIKIKSINYENMLCSFYSFRSDYYLNATYLNNFFQIKTTNILNVYQRNKLPKAVTNNNIKPISIFNKFHETTKVKKQLNKFINSDNFISKKF